MSFGPKVTTLGSVGPLVADNGSPIGVANPDTIGFDTQQLRFINAWVGLSGGTSFDVLFYVYNSVPNTWFLYTDVPQTTVLTVNGGGFFQLEMRGVSRIYCRVLSPVGAGVSAGILLQGVTY